MLDKVNVSGQVAGTLVFVCILHCCATLSKIMALIVTLYSAILFGSSCSCDIYFDPWSSRESESDGESVLSACATSTIVVLSWD